MVPFKGAEMNIKSLAMKSKWCPILIAVGVTLGCSDHGARATTLFYGGDPGYIFAGQPYTWDGYGGANTFDNYQAYEQFAVPTGMTWSVTGLFANIGVVDYASNPTPLANWYIRTGVTATSLGTLVASGTSTSASTTDTLNGITRMAMRPVSCRRLRCPLLCNSLAGRLTGSRCSQQTTPSTICSLAARPHMSTLWVVRWTISHTMHTRQVSI